MYHVRELKKRRGKKEEEKKKKKRRKKKRKKKKINVVASVCLHVHLPDLFDPDKQVLSFLAQILSVLIECSPHEN